MPGGVFSVFGNHTATAWLAFDSAGWNATMNAPTPEVVVGITSGSRSTGTSIAARGNGLGRDPFCSVKVVPAYTVTERPGIDLNV